MRVSFTQTILLRSILFLFGSIHLLIVLANHYYFRTFAFDYGVYNFAFYDFAHLRLSPCPVYLAMFPITFLQDHFSLLIPLLSPLYWLMHGWAGSYSLLIIQWVFVMAGAWYTYKFIKVKSENFTISLLAMVCYFAMFGRFSAYTADCNLVIMGSALVPIFIYYFETRRLAKATVLFAVILVSREDFPLLIFFLGLFLWFQNRSDKVWARYALIYTLISIFFFIAVFMLIVPALETAEKKFSLFNYKALGPDPGAALGFLLSHPLDSLSLLFFNHSGVPPYDWIKTSFYLVFLCSGGFLFFYRPVFILPFIPLIAKKMFNDDPTRWGTESYHMVEVATLLPLMSFWIISAIRKSDLRYVIASNVVTMSLAATLFRAYQSDTRKFNFFNPDFYSSEYPVADINAVIKQIPSDASVCASSLILPHLALRNEIYYFPVIKNAGYVLLYKNGESYPLHPQEYSQHTERLLADKQWKIISESGNFVALQKIAP